MSRTVVISITIPDGVEVGIARADGPPTTQFTAVATNVEPEYLADSFAPQAPAAPAFPPFPPLHCKDHPSAQTRIVPGGVSKKTGKPYRSFLACSYEGCNWKADAA